MKKLILSFSLLTTAFLFAPNSIVEVKASPTSDCSNVWVDTYNIWIRNGADGQLAIHKADFAYYNCINAGEPQVPQPPQ